MSSPRAIQPEHNDPYADEDMFFDSDEADELADPFEILARKEERAGVPLTFLTMEHDD